MNDYNELMNNPIALIKGLEEKNRDVKELCDKYEELAIQYAEAKKDYCVALARGILSLKAEGVKVTIIKEVVAGDEKIAELRLAKDIFEAKRKACMQAIRVGQDAIGSYRTLLVWVRKEAVG